MPAFLRIAVLMLGVPFFAAQIFTHISAAVSHAAAAWHAMADPSGIGGTGMTFARA